MESIDCKVGDTIEQGAEISPQDKVTNPDKLRALIAAHTTGKATTFEKMTAIVTAYVAEAELGDRDTLTAKTSTHAHTQDNDEPNITTEFQIKLQALREAHQSSTQVPTISNDQPIIQTEFQIKLQALREAHQSSAQVPAISNDEPTMQTEIQAKLRALREAHQLSQPSLPPPSHQRPYGPSLSN